MPVAAFNKITIIVTIVVCLGVFFACKANLDPTSDNINSNVSVHGPSILFLTYNIRKVEAGHSIELTLVNKIMTDGILKPSSNALKRGESGDLVCIQLDNGKEKLDELIIGDPLIKQVEYANQQGELAKKIINQTQTQFSIRLQLKPNTKYIRVEQVGAAEENNIELLISKL